MIPFDDMLISCASLLCENTFVVDMLIMGVIVDVCMSKVCLQMVL